MTKQEKIIEAYGKHWNLTNGNLNDDYSFDFIGSFSDYDLGTKFKIIFTGISIFRAIPFSIIGIEDNNGWIKIESETDLPKDDDGAYWISNENGRFDFIATGYQIKAKWKNETCTHYKEIGFPKDPIY